MTDERMQAALDQFAAAAHDLATAIRELWRCPCGKWNRTERCQRCDGEKP